jgi:hypothetical protein
MISYYRRGRLADKVAGAAVFGAGIESGFASLGLTTGQQAAFNTLNTSLQAAWLASTDPATRTTVTIGQRDELLAQTMKMAMDLAKIIYATPTVTDSQLNAIELASRPVRTPSHLIGEVPVLAVLKVQGRQCLIRVRGSARGKLPAAIGAVIFSAVGENPPAAVTDWTNEGPITKDTAIISFTEEEVAVGARVWFTAQWFNTKGVGPGCPAVSAIINADASMSA